MAGSTNAVQCPAGTVYVPGGVYEGRTIHPLCWDEHEFTNEDNRRLVVASAGSVQIVGVNSSGDTVRVIDSAKDPAALWAKYAAVAPGLIDGIAGYLLKPISDLPTSQSPDGFNAPQQPMVMMYGTEAQKFCEAQGKRLPDPLEWAYVASQGGTKEYSTRTGKLDEGVHYDADSTREVCQARGHYVAYDGKEICDLSGNAWEWTYDQAGADWYVNGGSWVINDPRFLAASFRYGNNPEDRGDDVGFRCVAPSQDSKK